MADENRRVAAATHDHARALAENLAKQGFDIVAVEPTQWVLRRVKRRRHETVTILVAGTPATAASWGPPTGPPAS